jgi:hypothetical protein
LSACSSRGSTPWWLQGHQGQRRTRASDNGRVSVRGDGTGAGSVGEERRDAVQGAGAHPATRRRTSTRPCRCRRRARLPGRRPPRTRRTGASLERRKRSRVGHGKRAAQRCEGSEGASTIMPAPTSREFRPRREGGSASAKSKLQHRRRKKRMPSRPSVTAADTRVAPAASQGRRWWSPVSPLRTKPAPTE